MIREKAFLFLDEIKGSSIKKSLLEIDCVLKNFNSEESILLRKKNLANILNHSIENTKFYSNLKGHSSLCDFPIIDKLTIRNHYEEFKAKKGFEKPLLHVQTSGSTGTPFKIIQDGIKRTRNTADTLFFGQKGGYTLGQPLFYCRKWSAYSSKSLLSRFTQNVIPVEVSKFSDDYLQNLVRIISKKKGPIAFIGYSSALTDFCRYLKKTNFESSTKVSSVIAMAEALNPNTKKDLESILDTNVLSRYSNVENGIIAQQIIGAGDNFHINWASYVVEILEIDTDRPADYGQLGRIVITDLFNYSMPMIRYDTGDLGVMEKDENQFNNAPVLKKVEGRKMDVLFDTQGNRVSPFIAYELQVFDQLKQFQIIQTDKKDYEILLNIEKLFDEEHNVKTKLQSFLGKDANINFKYVDEIPRLSSGKRKLTLNNYYIENK